MLSHSLPLPTKEHGQKACSRLHWFSMKIPRNLGQCFSLNSIYPKIHLCVGYGGVRHLALFVIRRLSCRRAAPSRLVFLTVRSSPNLPNKEEDEAHLKCLPRGHRLLVVGGAGLTLLPLLRVPKIPFCCPLNDICHAPTSSSGVIRIGPPVWNWRKRKILKMILAYMAANGPVWKPQALKIHNRIYRAWLWGCSQVWWTLLLLLLTTSASTCLQHSRNLRTAL